MYSRRGVALFQRFSTFSGSGEQFNRGQRDEAAGRTGGKSYVSYSTSLESLVLLLLEP